MCRIGLASTGPAYSNNQAPGMAYPRTPVCPGPGSTRSGPCSAAGPRAVRARTGRAGRGRVGGPGCRRAGGAGAGPRVGRRAASRCHSAAAGTTCRCAGLGGPAYWLCTGKRQIRDTLPDMPYSRYHGRITHCARSNPCSLRNTPNGCRSPGLSADTRRHSSHCKPVKRQIRGDIMDTGGQAITAAEPVQRVRRSSTLVWGQE